MAESKQVSTTTSATVLGQLHYSQKEAARFLQVGYLSLRDFPEIAGQIRLTADEAQTQHMMAIGLIKEFEITANHVVCKTVPLLKMGIEKKAKKMVEATLQKLLEYVNKMISKTRDTQERYALIKNKVQQSIACVEKKKTDVNKEGVAVESDIHLKMHELKLANDEYRDLQDKKERTAREIDELYQKRYKYLDQTVTSPERSAFNVVLDHVVTPATAMAAVGLAKGAAVAAAGSVAALTSALLPPAILVGGWALSYMQQTEESTRAFQASEAVAGDIKLKQEQDDRNYDRIQALKKESFEKIALIKQSFVTKAFLGNPESLVAAKRQLEKVGQYLEQLLEIWIQFGGSINQLCDSKDDTELLYIGSEENPEAFADELDKSVENIKMVWQGFKDDCSRYAEDSDREKRQLYDFLTESLDELSSNECNRKRDTILAQMESDLHNLSITYPRRRPIENKSQ